MLLISFLDFFSSPQRFLPCEAFSHPLNQTRDRRTRTLEPQGNPPNFIGNLDQLLTLLDYLFSFGDELENLGWVLDAAFNLSQNAIHERIQLELLTISLKLSRRSFFSDFSGFFQLFAFFLLLESELSYLEKREHLVNQLRIRGFRLRERWI